MENIRSDIYKVLISIVVLFILYHSAEYAIVFKNNVILFFVFQFLFFLSAWILGNWNKKNGFRFWGLSPTQLRVKYVLIGITSGVILYAIPFIISLSLGVETITKIPNWIDIIKFSIPFSFGVLFTSFSEDVLTRGTVFGLFNNKLKPVWIILISSLLYLLNHIYRLNDGFETLSYIFLLGVLFIIPVIITKNLWITGFMHWAGNTFFFVTHNAIQTDSHSGYITPNLIFSVWIIILIPIALYLGYKYKSRLT